MNIKEITSQDNITKILKMGERLGLLIEFNKVFYESEFGKPYRVTGNDELFWLHRVLNAKDNYKCFECDNVETITEIKELVSGIYVLIDNDFSNCSININKLANLDAIHATICRNSVSKLEMEFILGNIDRESINNIYSVLCKNVPKKYTKYDLVEHGKANELYELVKRSLPIDGCAIKNRIVEHYESMVSLIDPHNELNNHNEFLKAAMKKLCDISSIRMLLACKFKNDNFSSIVDDEFEYTINITANHMLEYVNEESDVDICDVRVGGNGFDIYFNVDKRCFHARAIPACGYFVRYHFNYIIN